MSPVATSLSVRLGPALAVVCVLALAGCTAFLADSAELPGPGAVEETHDSLEAYGIEGTYVVSGLENESPIRTETSVIARPGTGEMYEETVNESGARTISVSNGTTRWVYTVGERTVTRFPAQESLRDTAVVVDLVAAVNNASGSDPPQLFPAFRGVGTGQDPAGTTAASVGVSESVAVSYEGTETVAGRQTHVIATERPAADNASADAPKTQQRVYVDSEWYVILKVEAETRVDDRTYRTKFVVESVEFEPDVDDGLFEFEPPENATVVDPTSRYETIQNYEALAGAVPDPPDPDTPPNPGLRRARPGRRAYHGRRPDRLLQRRSDPDRHLDLCGRPLPSPGRARPRAARIGRRVDRVFVVVPRRLRRS
ncbi:hypothetical protein BRC62_04470 [Halobacteriales archaeon QH_10_67_13]|nr:MAG: hypothetical protein BRC62_04470 [Halobacteriales archaeon QH_10_67_13]